MTIGELKKILVDYPDEMEIGIKDDEEIIQLEAVHVIPIKRIDFTNWRMERLSRGNEITKESQTILLLCNY